MNEVRCSRCKVMFVPTDGKPPYLCPKCKGEREAKLRKVHELVRAKPGITPMELQALTGVPISVITQAIKDGFVEEMGKG